MQRSINHLKKRFETAVRYKKPLWINEADINALNCVIEANNGKPKCSQLEDSLMLFYLLQYWKVENQQNKTLKMVEKQPEEGVFKISGADIILQKLSMLINPKNEIISQIRDELRLHQALNNIPKEQRITTAQVQELVDEVLEIAKNHFPLIRDLDKCEVKITR